MADKDEKSSNHLNTSKRHGDKVPAPKSNTQGHVRRVARRTKRGGLQTAVRRQTPVHPQCPLAAGFPLR